MVKVFHIMQMVQRNIKENLLKEKWKVREQLTILMMLFNMRANLKILYIMDMASAIIKMEANNMKEIG